MRRQTGRDRRFGPQRVAAAWSPLSDPDTVLWLDAPLSPRTESDGVIDQLNDLSPYGYHATNSTTLRPAYNATILGGEYPGIVFGGSGKQLLTPALAALDGASGCTVFLVAATPVATANRVILEYGSGGGGSLAGSWALYDNIGNANSLTFFTRGNGAAQNYWRADAESEPMVTHKVITCSLDFAAAAAAEVQAIRSNGAALSGAQTGTNENTGTLSSQVLSIGCLVNATAPVGLNLGALIVVKRKLSDAEKAVFESYLMRRFGLVSNAEMAARTVPRIVWAGQSNAVGDLDAYTEIAKWAGPHTAPRIWAYKDTTISTSTATDDWGPLRESQPSPGPGLEAPDLVTCATLVRHYRLAPELIMVAKGATSLGVDWDPDATDSMFDRLEAALDAISTHPDPPASPVPWVVWIQGESDAADAGRAAAYEANLTTFIAAVRAIPAMAGSKWVIVKLHADNASGSGANVALVRAAQEVVVAADPDAYIVSVDDLELRADNVHYTEATAIEVGKRIAAVIGAHT